MKNKILLIFVEIEAFIIIFGMFMLMIVNYIVTQQDLKLIKERQERLKNHTVYKNCVYEERKCEK